MADGLVKLCGLKYHPHGCPSRLAGFVDMGIPTDKGSKLQRTEYMKLGCSLFQSMILYFK